MHRVSTYRPKPGRHRAHARRVWPVAAALATYSTAVTSALTLLTLWSSR